MNHEQGRLTGEAIVAEPFSRNRESRAEMKIGMSAIFFSFLPIFFVLGDAESYPLTFVSLAVSFSALLSILLAGPRMLKRKAAVLKSVLWVESKWLTGLTVVGPLSYILYSLALDKVSPMIAVLLFELWPVAMIALIAFCSTFKSLRDDNPQRGVLLLALALCLGGVTIFSGSQQSDSSTLYAEWFRAMPGWFGDLWDLSNTLRKDWLNVLREWFSVLRVDWFKVITELYNALTTDRVAGVWLAALAGFFGGLHIACTRLIAKRLSNKLTEPVREPEEKFCELVSFIPQHLVMAIVFTVCALIYEDVEWTSWKSVNLVVMAFLWAYFAVRGAETLRMANRMARSSINVVYFVAPVLSLVWLYIMGLEGDNLNWNALCLGFATILTGTVIAVFNADRSRAFKGLIFSLWLFGGWVYVNPRPNYYLQYEAVAAIVTVFVLLLSFRTDRVVRRIEREEANIVWLWRMLSEYDLTRSASKGQKRVSKAQEILHTLVTSSRLTLGLQAYEKLQNYRFRRCGTDCAEVRARIDALVHSKQQGTNMGELMAICILGLVAIIILLLLLPSQAKELGIVNLIARLSSVLLSSSIVFLFFYLVDLQCDRWRYTIDQKTTLLKSQSADNPPYKVFISILVSSIIVLLYVYLLWSSFESPG